MSLSKLTIVIPTKDRTEFVERGISICEGEWVGGDGRRFGRRTLREESANHGGELL